MTENEAKQKLENLHYKIIHTSFCNKVYEIEIVALCMAKDALEKIQQYRAIGTVEELKALKDKHIGKDNMVISSSDLMTILNSDSEELKSLKDENAYLHSELQAIGATADMFEKEIRAKAIDEFVGMLEFSLMNNYRHLLKIDMDEFEWLTTDSVLTHIRKVKEQLKGGAE